MQEQLKVKIKRLHPDSVIPQYGKPGDAGMDLTAISKQYDDVGNAVYGTGLSMEIPEGYVGLIFPRSSVSNFNQFLTNCVGVIDSGYRGEIMSKFKPVSLSFCMNVPNGYKHDLVHREYEIGDRVAQIIIVPYPQVEFVLSDELTETVRGDGGFGHTGR